MPSESPASATGQRARISVSQPSRPARRDPDQWERQASPPLNIRTAAQYKGIRKVVKIYPRVPEWGYNRRRPLRPSIINPPPPSSRALRSTKWYAANTGSLSGLHLFATDPGSAPQRFALQRVRDDGEERFSVGRLLNRPTR